MRLTFRFFAFIGALMGIYIAAALQSGPETVDANLCKIARRFFSGIPDQCIPTIDVWGTGAAVALVLACALVLICDGIIWHRGRKKRSPPKHGGKFSEIMEAIWWVAERSAWGRWQTAQRLASGGSLPEENKLHLAEHVVRDAAQNGDLQISGRVAGTTSYSPIDQHFWRLVFFNLQRDDRTLWRAVLTPRAGVTTPIPDYDSFIVGRSQLESLWSQRDLKVDWLTAKLRMRSKFSALSAAIKAVEPSRMIIAGLAVIVVGVVIGGAMIGIGLWQQTKAAPTAVAQNTPSPPAASSAIPKLLPDTDDGIIKWSRGYILSASGSSDAPIKIFGFQATGQSESDEFIEPLGGFVRSEITGRQFPILVNDNGTLVSSEGYGIPARHQFQIGAKLSEAGMSTVEFLRDFGRLTFEFRYGSNVYVKRFSPEELEAEVRRTEIDLRPKPIHGAAGVRKRDAPTSSPPASQNAPILEKKSEVIAPRRPDGIIRAQLQILTEFFDCLEQYAVPTYRFGLNNLWNQWNVRDSKIAPNEFLELLVQFHHKTLDTHQRLEAIALKNQRYPEIAQSPQFWYNAKLHEKDNLLMAELKRIIKDHPNDDRAVLLMNNRFVDEWYVALNDYSNWIKEKKTYISDKQRELEAA
jgi:hypothetical protein